MSPQAEDAATAPKGQNRVRLAIYAACFAVGVLVIVLVVLAIQSEGSLASWGSPVVAAGALAVALAALNQSAKSADAAARNAALAELQEQRRQYGWTVTPRSNGHDYELRNVGTLNARDVRLSGDFFVLDFAGRQRGSDETVDIAAGEAKVIYAAASFGQVGHEVAVTWTPEGQGDRTWTVLVPPRQGDDHERRDKQRDDRIRTEQYQREDARDIRELLLRVGDAYSEWKVDQDDAAKKLRLQLLVAALPPSYAREIGYQVDVARDVWGPSEFPFTDHVREEDRELIAGLEAEIELMWNMRTVAGYPVYGPEDAAGTETEPRIWWALLGYADRVRERESGERKLRDSPEDARTRKEDEARFRQLDALIASRRAAAEQESEDPA